MMRVERFLCALRHADRRAILIGNTPLTPSGDYVDWSLGATVAWRNLTLGAAYVDTNLSGAEAATGGAARDIVDGAVVATLGASF